MRAFGKLSSLEELREVKNKFWSRLGEMNKKTQPTSVGQSKEILPAEEVGDNLTFNKELIEEAIK